jgi:hypothetical protein
MLNNFYLQCEVSRQCVDSDPFRILFGQVGSGSGSVLFDKKIGTYIFANFKKMIQFVFDYIHISLENL